MGFGATIPKLMTDQRVVDRFPVEVIDSFYVLHERGVPRVGSLLRDRLSGGCAYLTIPYMYVSGAPEAHILQEVEQQAREHTKEQQPSAKSIWYTTCRTIAEISKQAVSTALTRRLPNDVTQPNLESGAADVMDLPGEIAERAVTLLDSNEQAGIDYAFILIACLAKLFGMGCTERAISVLPISSTSFNRFFNEFIGASALYIIGVCPENHLPADTLAQTISKRESEIKKKGRTGS